MGTKSSHEQFISASTGEVYEADIQHADRKNSDFIQMYRDFIANLADLSRDNSTALTVLLFIAQNMDGRNSLICPMKVFVEKLNMTRQTISKQVKYLQEHGWLAVHKSGTMNIYIVNQNVFWTSYEWQKQYCEFDGKLIIPMHDFDITKSQIEHLKYIDLVKE